jgi:DNA repair protein RadC
VDKLSIKKIPLEDRPYEKFEKHGGLVLTDAELLAIIIKSGTKDLNSVDVARLLLTRHENGHAGFNHFCYISSKQIRKKVCRLQNPGRSRDVLHGSH